MQTIFFLQSYVSLVTFKIRSMSPKSNHLFWLSQISICATLVKIHPTVQKLDRRQKPMLQHRYRNHLIFHHFEELCQFSSNIGNLNIKGADAIPSCAYNLDILLPTVPKARILIDIQLYF